MNQKNDNSQCNSEDQHRKDGEKGSFFTVHLSQLPVNGSGSGRQLPPPGVRFLRILFRTEDSVAGIAEAGNNIAMVV